MTTHYALGPVIGTLGGGGRESQEIALTRSNQTITLEEGRWLLAGDGEIRFNGSSSIDLIRVLQGPSTHTASVMIGSATLYIAPLTD